MAQFAELIVNVPIRRSFSRHHADPPPPEPAAAAADDEDSAAAPASQTFHYHLPVALEGRLQPGHLVWVPFGRQTVQGVVIRLTDHAPVPTKPIQRLARPLPVLTALQLELAAWIAHTYVAPLAEAVKLFLPPGLLTRQPDEAGIQAKRELRIELIGDAETIWQRLPTLGRETPQTRVLSWLLAHPQQPVDRQTLQTACALKSVSAIQTLLGKQLLTQSDDQIRLALPPAETQVALQSLQGLDRYLPVLQTLLSLREAIWKSDLYSRTDTDLDTLRALQQAGLLRLTEEVRSRDPLAQRSYPRSSPPPLTEEQATVWSQIQAAMRVHPAAHSRSFLLHGVTGSGKTEIYLRTIAACLAEGRQAIVLVPEIALTPQTVARFAGRFPDRVAVIHSELSPGERYDTWRRIRDGGADVVVGPRSALFAPLARLGLIVLDEEHESTYKQDAEEWGSFTVFYDARTVARRLAELSASLLILGSATPSLESYYAAQQAQLTLLELPRRVMGHTTVTIPRVAAGAAQEPTQTATAYMELPPVEIVDMRQELRAGNREIFSRSLMAELQRTLAAGEQAILFLNRRGTHTFVICRDCGHVEQCPRCEVPFTYHERVNVLICHHCNRRAPIPAACPVCGSRRIKYFGSGTQRLEDLVQRLLPAARLLRWDADTTSQKGSHEALMQRFAEGSADILIGTQMIAKGLDLPMVTLVGVIAADVGLYLPDFRSGERTFQLLTQVAGRAGRSERGGRVVLQSYTPEHYAIQAAAQHDYSAFYRRELAFRTEHDYPPLRRLAKLVYWHKKLAKAQQASTEMASQLRYRLQQMGLLGDWIDVLGPAPAFFARYRGYYRWQILLRAPDPATVLHGLPIPFGWRVDIDPMSLL